MTTTTATTNYDDDVLTGRIIACAIRVHQVLGPGFLESIYRRAMLIELQKRALQVETELNAFVLYEGEVVGRHRLDIVVQKTVVLELKTVAALNLEHYAQLRSYMKATRLPAGLLINFSGPKADYRRLDLAG